MCQQPSTILLAASSCPTTIKANSRVRRSSHRCWMDSSSETNASTVVVANKNDVVNILNSDPCCHDERMSVKKNRRHRCRRPFRSKNEKKQHHHHLVDFSHYCHDDSTAPLSSDESFSFISVSSSSSSSSSSSDSVVGSSSTKKKTHSPPVAVGVHHHHQQHSKKKNNRPQHHRSNKSRLQRQRPKSLVDDSVVSPDEKSRYIALDAEMVGVGPNGYYSRLARIVLTDWDGNVLYDTMVCVNEEVTDYRTHVSGITPEDILCATTTTSSSSSSGAAAAGGGSGGALPYEIVQKTVHELVQNKIIVGHGLKNDFRALGLHTHPWYDIRDTARYEPFMIASSSSFTKNNAFSCCTPSSSSSSPTTTTTTTTTLISRKLRTLAKDKLNMTIQVDGQPHNPIEDAIAAMELYKKHRVKWEKTVQYKMERTREITTSCTMMRNNI